MKIQKIQSGPKNKQILDGLIIKCIKLRRSFDQITEPKKKHKLLKRLNGLGKRVEVRMNAQE